MVEINVVPNVGVEYTGILNFLEVYMKAKDFIVNLLYEWGESEYSERLTSSGGKDLVIKWSCQKNIDLYVQQRIDVKIQTFDLVDVDVVVNGKKIRMQKGTIRFNVDANVRTDRQGKWEDTPMLHFFQHFYERYIYKGMLDISIRNLTGDGQQLQAYVRDMFEGYRQMHLAAQ